MVYAVTGILLLIGKKTRAAAAWLGLTVLFVELVVYVPIGVVERASLNNGLNYVMDTLMFCGTVLLLARAMPREAEQPNYDRRLGDPAGLTRIRAEPTVVGHVGARVTGAGAVKPVRSLCRGGIFLRHSPRILPLSSRRRARAGWRREWPPTW